MVETLDRGTRSLERNLRSLTTTICSSYETQAMGGWDNNRIDAAL